MRELLPRVLGLRPTPPPTPELRRRLDGRVVVVTGASRGVGAETARRLAGVGARVVLVARDEQRLARVAEGVRARGGEAHVLPADLGDLDAARRAGERVLAELGPPEAVVANAGVSLRRAAVASADRPRDLARTIAVNYAGPVALVSSLLAAMCEAGRGHVVSIASTSVDVPAPGWSLYGASKSAMDAWLRAVALELEPHGVAVTSIRLPLVRTAMSAPTRAYDAVPAMRPVDAAKLVARAIVDRPRVIAPWWSTLAGAVLAASPTALDPVLRRWDRMIERAP